jgi:cytochrome oxidase Cu insertion factor (SCO1/SenC/PrrC family)
VRTLLFVVALCAVVAVGCGGGDDEAAPPRSEPQTLPEKAPAPVASDRSAAPPLEGETLDGEVVSLADLRGRPVFVNVWSSW